MKFLYQILCLKVFILNMFHQILGRTSMGTSSYTSPYSWYTLGSNFEFYKLIWVLQANLGICLTILLQTFANTFTLNHVFAQARRTIIFDFWTARNFVSMASLTMELSLQTKSIRHALVQSYLEKLGVGKKAIHRLMRQPAEFPGLWYFIHRDGKD